MAFLSILLFTKQAALSELEADGTGVVNGYLIGPGVDLKDANLRGVDLRGANLEGANLQNADLEGSDLGMASLIGCNLDGVNLSGALLNGVRLSDANVAPAIAGVGRSTHLKVIDLEDRMQNISLNTGLLLDDGQNREIRLSDVEKMTDDHELNIGLLLDDGQNREFRITDLEKNSESQVNDIEVLKDEVKAMREQLERLAEELPALRAAVAERDERIALLEERPTMEQLMDTRASTIIRRVEDDQGGKINLSLRIEQSEDFKQWVPLDEVISYSIPVVEGKKYYRFALAR